MVNQIQQTQATDYLYASARVRAMESGLLNRERLRRMAEAATEEDALRVLAECGYGEELTAETLNQALEAKRQAVFYDTGKMLPEPRLMDIFRLKYDYHNLKALLKGQAIDQPYAHLLLEGGLVPVELLEKSAAENDFFELPPQLRQAAREARELLNRTQDPRLADTALDRAMYAQMLATAQESGIKFLLDYVQLSIDSANLRAVVRLKKMNQDYARIGDFYLEGGTIPLNRLKVDLTPEALEAIYASSPLEAAARAGARALRGESGLAALDLAADDALIEHLTRAKYVGFGVEPVLAFLAAAELEAAAVQTVLAGRRAGASAETILERLRKTYA